MILFRAKSIDRLRREQEKTTTHHSHITKWVRCKVSAYSDFFFKTNKASIFRVPGSLHIGLALIWIGRMIVCMCGLMLSIPLSMPYTWPPYNTSSICKLDTLLLLLLLLLSALLSLVRVRNIRCCCIFPPRARPSMMDTFLFCAPAIFIFDHILYSICHAQNVGLSIALSLFHNFYE